MNEPEFHDELNQIGDVDESPQKPKSKGRLAKAVRSALIFTLGASMGANAVCCAYAPPVKPQCPSVEKKEVKAAWYHSGQELEKRNHEIFEHFKTVFSSLIPRPFVPNTNYKKHYNFKGLTFEANLMLIPGEKYMEIAFQIKGPKGNFQFVKQDSVKIPIPEKKISI